MVIDDGMHVVEPDVGFLVGVVITGGSPAVRFSSAAVGDTANLLDVHVNEFAGPVNKLVSG
jgi:hypothetical protein